MQGQPLRLVTNKSWVQPLAEVFRLAGKREKFDNPSEPKG